MINYRLIYFALLLTVLSAIFYGLESSYAAYVTHKMIISLELKDKDALNFEMAFNKHITNAIFAFIVIVCQSVIFFGFRHLRKRK